MPWGGSNFVSVSSVFVGRETGGTDAVGDGDAVGVGDGDELGVVVGVGGTVLFAAGEDVGDGCAAGEISFCGDGVLLGVADVAAFDSVGVGDLRAPDGVDFGFGVGVGRGGGVCALRSTPM
ncbi:MAG TPA: hypothetical protein VNW72_01620 [Chthoniobacterales bacterium]|nr:hypothetical protein [Chthoniobacterales bacterium]